MIFEAIRDTYQSILGTALMKPKKTIIVFLGLSLSTLILFPFLGQDFFPTVDGGQIKLHLRAHVGTRIEETAKLCDEVETLIRHIIPSEEIDNIADNIGLPNSGINLSYSNSAPIGPADADILIFLRESHRSTESYIRLLREKLPFVFPGISFSFLPADIVSQILNFGLPSPVDIQIIGNNQKGNRQYAESILAKLNHVSGIADLHIQQSLDYPVLHVDVDRARAQDLGLTEANIASNLLISLSGSFQNSPNFWLNPLNGVSYPVISQVPQSQLNSIESLKSLPINAGNDGLQSSRQYLGNIAHISRGVAPAVASHYNILPVIDIFASLQDRDLGGLGKDIQVILDESKNILPKGSTLQVRGQLKTMKESFLGLSIGLVFAILLVYLLIVVNFQSWIDPFIIITALPVALAGIIWFLFMTFTTLSVPALTGSIMCMGVATANSILVISFARERLENHGDATRAALEAGFSRFRPVLMTAFAMIIGMIPMALGLGEGGEQNAPLGRAVIGGLSFATLATLFLVPVVFSFIHSGRLVKRSQ
jgi:multidrug efflux pump subunit AcrB